MLIVACRCHSRLWLRLSTIAEEILSSFWRRNGVEYFEILVLSLVGFLRLKLRGITPNIGPVMVPNVWHKTGTNGIEHVLHRVGAIRADSSITSEVLGNGCSVPSDISKAVMIFTVFPPFFTLSPRRSHSFRSTTTYFFFILSSQVTRSRWQTRSHWEQLSTIPGYPKDHDEDQ